MIKNITIDGFELAVTARVLCDRLIDHRSHRYRDVFGYDEVISQGVFASNDLIADLGLSKELRARKRGSKVFIFSEYDNRILAELAISSEKARHGLLRRPRFVLLNRRGFIKEKTIADLLAKPNRPQQFRRTTGWSKSNKLNRGGLQ